MEKETIKFSLAMLEGFKDDSGPSQMITYKRDFTEKDVKILGKSHKLLAELTARSPYKQFQDRYDDFFAKIGETTDKSATGKLRPYELYKVYGKLDDLLSSLKVFEDRTKSLLSDRYGKDSTQMTEFQTALSYEFDNTFEYRFFYNLRNYSQHKGSHFGKLQSSAELVNGKPKGILEIMLNGEDLLKNYSKWHSTVKHDLNSMKSDFALTPIIQKLKLSCFRVYSRYLLAQEDEILSSIKSIKNIVGDYDSDNESPTIMEIHEGFGKQGGKITLSSIGVNLIDTIQPLLKSAHHYAVAKK